MLASFFFAFLGLFGMGAAGGGGGGSSSSSSGRPTPTPSAEKERTVEEPADPVEPPVTSTDNEPPVVVEEPADPTPTTGDQDINAGGGETTPTDVTSSFSVAGGRVTTLQVNNHENVESIRLLSDPSHGNLTVNPDNTLALVLSHEPDFSGRIDFSYEVTYSDNTTEVHASQANVQTTTQQDGWGQGNFYMLETDEAGDVIVEYGDNHREVHISGSNDALGLSDIAALEGLSVSQIDQDWLIAHDEYGSGPDMALDSEAGMRLWYGITGVGTEPSSHWLLFERGYEYDDLGRVIDRGTVGEDPMHPIHITSYGDGIEPILNTRVTLFQESNENIVISDLAITGGVQGLSGKNLLFDNVDVSMIEGTGTTGLSVHSIDGFTLHNSSITDVYQLVPNNPNDSTWTNEMSSGLYLARNSGVLIEGTLFDHNGWAPDYEYNMSTDGGLPPTMFNHNMYIQDSVTDFTLRDSVVMQGASYGAKVRPGGFIEDNVMLDNNNAATVLGGVYANDAETIRTGSFTLFTDNVITSAAHRETNSDNLGAVSRGVDNGGMDTTMLDNIIAHLADPNNPDEMDDKTSAQRVLWHGADTPYYDDTIVYNWTGSKGSQPDQNTDGLNTSTLDATTIQRFTQQLLGDPDAGIPELADFLRAQADGSLDDYVDADLIIAYFQTGFGLTPELDTGADTNTFVPNDLGDGMRWDNRLNWDQQYLPQDGQNVDLGGNWVNYGGTSTINNLGLGDDGELGVGNGKLTVDGQTTAGDDGGTINVFNVGQIWMNGYNDADALHLNVDGGRFANTGDMSGNTQTTITDGQAILAADGANYDVEAGSALNIIGSDAKVGFDGETGDTAVLRLAEDGTLSFTADSNGFSGIEEFRSGALGDAPDVASGANLGFGDLEIDLSNLGETTGSFDLLSVDEMIGELSNISITGLAGNRNAEFVVDYETDKLMLNITGGGNGRVDLSQIGEETDMDHADSSNILAALTAGQGAYSDDLPTDLEVNGEETLLAEMLV